MDIDADIFKCVDTRAVIKKSHRSALFLRMHCLNNKICSTRMLYTGGKNHPRASEGHRNGLRHCSRGHCGAPSSSAHRSREPHQQPS